MPFLILSKVDYVFSPDAVLLIAKFEGFRARPYFDSVGIPTIGYGTTVYPNGMKVAMSDPSINKDKAGEMLLFHLNKIELPDLNKCITRDDLNQHQIDAIGCLIYNIGDKGFCGSHLHEKINNNAPIDDLQEAWLKWSYARGKQLPGLLKRRTIEFNFYNKQ